MGAFNYAISIMSPILVSGYPYWQLGVEVKLVLTYQLVFWSWNGVYIDGQDNLSLGFWEWLASY